jgi:hypothetical protein
MKRFWLAPAAIAAVAIGLSMSAAQSAPAMSTLDGLRSTAAEQGMVTDVRRRCHRHCRWRDGRRICHRHCRD